MNARFVTIAAAALMLSASGAAEPPKAPSPQANPNPGRTGPVVLASAERVATPAAETASAPVRHRAARVTTCRCGGEPQPDSQEEQP